MDFENLAPDLQERARACKSPDELLALAKQEGYGLSDAELEQIWRRIAKSVAEALLKSVRGSPKRYAPSMRYTIVAAW